MPDSVITYQALQSEILLSKDLPIAADVVYEKFLGKYRFLEPIFLNKLRNLTTENKISFTQAADLCGVSSSMFSHAMSGKRNLNAPQIASLCALNNLSIHELISGQPPVVNLPASLTALTEHLLFQPSEILYSCVDESFSYFMQNTPATRPVGSFSLLQERINYLCHESKVSLSYLLSDTPALYRALQAYRNTHKNEDMPIQKEIDTTIELHQSPHLATQRIYANYTKQATNLLSNNQASQQRTPSFQFLLFVSICAGVPVDYLLLPNYLQFSHVMFNHNNSGLWRSLLPPSIHSQTLTDPALLKILMCIVSLPIDKQGKLIASLLQKTI